MPRPTERCPKRIRLYSRSEFIEKVFFTACNAGAVVVAFNLPFDLVASRGGIPGGTWRGRARMELRYFAYKHRKKASGCPTPFVLASSFDQRIPRPRSFAWLVGTGINPSGRSLSGLEDVGLGSSKQELQS